MYYVIICNDDLYKVYKFCVVMDVNYIMYNIYFIYDVWVFVCKFCFFENGFFFIVLLIWYIDIIYNIFYNFIFLMIIVIIINIWNDNNIIILLYIIL